MASVVEDEELDTRHDSARGNYRYPWDEWLDGQTWRLVRGEDFTTQINSFRSTAIIRAKARGVKLKTVVDGEAVYLRALTGSKP